MKIPFMNRDGANTSLWQSSVENYISLTNEIPGDTFDVLIIGGGITGITTALRLQQSGKKCILAEAYTLGFGTTGGTTAHLNNFFDTPYGKVMKEFGEENARLLADGARESIALIRQQVKDLHIDCSFDEKEAYLFALNEKQDKELEEIVDAMKKVNVPVGYINDSPFPVPYLKVACIREQAQFNPVPYIFRLAKAFEDAGGTIIQNCRVTAIKEDEILEATTSAGNIKARNAIYATHIPPGVNILHFRCAPYRSYAIGVKLKNDRYPAALGYDMNDPYHYYRTQEENGQKYLIAGGEDHKTGHEENTTASFRRLESHVRSYFDVESVAFHWSSQYFEPADGLPYIGHLPGKASNIFVATGFGGNGMIYGTLTAIILSDIIGKGTSVYKDLFDPARVKPVAGFANFVKEAADVVKELLSAPFSGVKIKELSEMAAGEARVVKYEGATMALYKDEQHNLHALNSACTHIKCTVAWNESERSWDCPCHGSRFNIDGNVLTGPARRNLEVIEFLKSS